VRTRRGRVLWVFLDGVGIGEDDEAVNPFAGGRAGAVVPTLQELLGGRLPTLDAPHQSGSHARSLPLDARLDVDGLPQSGTGQAALLTGQSAAEIFGRHFGPWTPVRLRPTVEEGSALRRAADAGLDVTFANAYPRDWPGPRGGLRIAGPPLAARGVAAMNRHEEALGQGRAVSSEIVNDGWQRHLGHDWIPSITPETAGANLARIGSEADLTLYAHYTTDSAGHAESMTQATRALSVVDRFFAGLLEELDPDTTLLVASDHGNIEDIRQGHTLNPALGIVAGPGAEAAEGLADLRDVAPFVLDLLGVEG
jgi:2,3-bisphosphoglycerate-independent phosphoglycerate mutase